MRTPTWEASPGALGDLLASRVPLDVVDLYTLTLPSGTTAFRWSARDASVRINGRTWTLGPGIERGNTTTKIGVEVATLQVTLVADDRITIAGSPLIHYAARGGLDGATLQVDRAFRPLSAADWTGHLYWFGGRVVVDEVDTLHVRLSVKSSTELLAVKIPRDVYQAGCLNTLYDGACGLSRNALRVSSTAAAASNAARTSFAHTLAQPAGYFSLGVVTFTGGLNADVSRTIKSHDAGVLRLLTPLPFPVAAGDAFDVWPGCDKTRNTCAAKFSNLSRFRGQPFIPVAETVT